MPWKSDVFAQILEELKNVRAICMTCVCVFHVLSSCGPHPVGVEDHS